MSDASRTSLGRIKITENGPGSILRDFQTLLDFVGLDGVKASGRHARLPMAHLSALDEQMARPIRPALKRPQQRSFPNLNGLYLLLRATELAFVRRVGKTNHLVLDPEQLAKWRELNPTERYCNLLEAWLLIADESMWGTGFSRWHMPFLQDVLHLLTLLGVFEHSELDPRTPEELQVHNQAHLALLEMFGFVDLERVPARPGENWRILAVHGTDLGAELFGFFHELRRSVRLDELLPEPSRFGAWQSLLGRFFPEWHRNLSSREVEFRDGIYVFKLSLDSVWRRVAIPAAYDFEDLADVILEAFDFDDDHLYRFALRDRNGSLLTVDHPACDSETYADELAIGNAPIQVGDTFSFLYDFGDQWFFKITLENIEPPDPRREDPELIESHGKAPRQYG